MDTYEDRQTDEATYNGALSGALNEIYMSTKRNDIFSTITLAFLGRFL